MKRRVLVPCAAFHVDDDAMDQETEETVINIVTHERVLDIEEQVCLFQQQGCTLAEAGDFVGALNQWQRGLCLQGDNSVLFELTAQALLEVEEYIRACAYAEKAVALTPNWGAAYQTLGRCQREAGELELSEQSYMKALELIVDDEEVVSELAEVRGLLVTFRARRAELRAQLEGGDVVHPEACACIWNLTSRASNFLNTDPTRMLEQPTGPSAADLADILRGFPIHR